MTRRGAARERTSARARTAGVRTALILALVLLTARVAVGQSALDEARAHVRAGRLHEALALYSRRLDAHPEDVEALKERARLHGRLHDHPEALLDYERALALTPRDVEAVLGRAGVLVRLDRLDDAHRALQAAVTAHEDVADAHLALGALELRLGRVEAAASAFTRARELAPEDPSPLVGLARARAAAGDAPGAAFLRQDALAAFARRLERDPADRDARVGRAQLLAGLGRDAEALADYEAVLGAAPHDVEALLGRVGLLVRQGRLDDAEAGARAAVLLDPRAWDAWVALGDVLSRRRQWADAARAYEEARRLAPRAPEPLLGLARLRLWQDDLAGARAGYAAALGLDPRSEDALDALARIARAEQAARPPRFRLYLTGRYEALEGRSDWWQGTMVLAVRPRPGTSVFVGVDQYHRSDRDDTQLSLGAGQALPGGVAVAGSVARAVDAEVIARWIFEVEVSRPLARWITPSLRFRWSDFVGGVYAAALAPGIEVTPTPAVALLARYYFTRSSDAGDGHAGSLRVTLFPEGRWSVYGALAYGRETYRADTVENAVRGLDVLTLAAGVRWRVREALALRLDYEYEDRRGSYTKHGVGVGVVVEF